MTAAHEEELDEGWVRIALRTQTLPPATSTNAMIVGLDRFVVVDPGPSDPDEQERLVAAVTRRLERGAACIGIVLTHHHLDHTSGLRALIGALAPRQGSVAVYIHPDELARLDVPPRARPLEVEDGAEVVLGRQHLRFLHTPGHTRGHMALHDPAARILYAGDMVASEGTIVIAPPDGDMAAYMASLDRLLQLQLRILVPSHGHPIEGAEAVQAHLRHYIDHRLMREGLVLGALDDTPRGVAELLPRAYADVAPLLWPLAAQSLTAHLLKLEAEGRARRSEERWSRAAG